MKKGIICVCYVDDTIFAGPDEEILEQEIKKLGINYGEQRHSFALRNEGEVGAFLGIQITKNKPNEFYLTQTGLINKVLTAAGMEDCNGVDTPAATTPLGADVDGLPFNEQWEYRSISQWYHHGDDAGSSPGSGGWRYHPGR